MSEPQNPPRVVQRHRGRRAAAPRVRLALHRRRRGGGGGGGGGGEGNRCARTEHGETREWTAERQGHERPAGGGGRRRRQEEARRLDPGRLPLPPRGRREGKAVLQPQRPRRQFGHVNSVRAPRQANQEPHGPSWIADSQGGVGGVLSGR